METHDKDEDLVAERNLVIVLPDIIDAVTVLGLSQRNIAEKEEEIHVETKKTLFSKPKNC